ncbi:MAG TPA: carbohydrate kinase family protein [Candidatus Limnocylindrales bacterium]|nr:carbohydrate kinase family protein [Candidatus Limnocylindrales bacterium]
MTADASPGGRDLDLVVLGDVNPDILVVGGRPEFGQHEVLVEAIAMTIGGSAAIMAAGAARLGLRVALVGVVGRDPFGDYVLDALARRGVDTTHCRIDPAQPTGATVVLTAGDDRAILTATGAITDLGGDDVGPDLLRRTRHVHVASYFLQPRLRADLPAIAARAREAGATVSVDPNWDPSGAWDGGLMALLPELDVVLPNEAEATRIARASTAEDAAARLQVDGSRPIVVVKRGVDGALARGADGSISTVPAWPIEAVDAVGAGDAFDAGFLAAWLNGEPLGACLRFAAVCGALSTRAAGGVDGQATRDEVDAVLRTWLER